MPALLGAQPAVMNTGAAGYLERGKLMYESRNYVGAIDQLSHLGQLPADAQAREEADYYIALSKSATSATPSRRWWPSPGIIHRRSIYKT